MSFVDGTNHAPKRCKGCFYRRQSGHGLSTCDLLFLTGIIRGCPPEECEHYSTKARGQKYREQKFIQRMK